eukprot:EG_transcript_33737
MDLMVLGLLLLGIFALALASHLLKPPQRAAVRAEGDGDDEAEEEEEGLRAGQDPPGLMRRHRVNARKAEKQRQREEQRLAREAMLEQQRRRREEQELRRAEAEEKERERLAQEVAAQREAEQEREEAADEEYLRWKGTMTVEEEGVADSGDEKPNPDALKEELLAEVKANR